MAHTIGGRMGFQGVLTGQEVRERRNLKDMTFLYGSILAIFLCVAVLFAYLWTRLSVTNLGYEISRANSQRLGLVEQNRRLRIEQMRLKSPERIERIASTELNLVHPKGDQIIKIR